MTRRVNPVDGTVVIAEVDSYETERHELVLFCCSLKKSVKTVGGYFNDFTSGKNPNSIPRLYRGNSETISFQDEATADSLKI